MLVRTAEDSPEPQQCKRTLVIYGSKGKSDDLLLSSQSSGHVCFRPGATDEFLVSRSYTVQHGDCSDILIEPQDILEILPR